MQQKQQQHHAIMENQTQTLLHCKPPPAPAAYSRSSSISSNWRHFTLLPCLSALPCLSPAPPVKKNIKQAIVWNFHCHDERQRSRCFIHFNNWHWSHWLHLRSIIVFIELLSWYLHQHKHFQLYCQRCWFEIDNWYKIKVYVQPLQHL